MGYRNTRSQLHYIELGWHGEGSVFVYIVRGLRRSADKCAGCVLIVLCSHIVLRLLHYCGSPPLTSLTHAFPETSSR